MILKLTFLKMLNFIWTFTNTVNAVSQTTTGTIDTQIQGWASGIQNILKIVVGLFAIIGGFLIFLQYMQGNDQAQKNFIKFIIGLAIFGLVRLIAGFFLP